MPPHGRATFPHFHKCSHKLPGSPPSVVAGFVRTWSGHLLAHRLLLSPHGRATFPHFHKCSYKLPYSPPSVVAGFVRTWSGHLLAHRLLLSPHGRATFPHFHKCSHKLPGSPPSVVAGFVRTWSGHLRPICCSCPRTAAPPFRTFTSAATSCLATNTKKHPGPHGDPGCFLTTSALKRTQFFQAHAKSNRSRFMTLVQAETKSLRNFSSESAVA